ncbi:MAG TPA: alpha/beta hydrolase [Thermoanaerobaculia bacterium]|jgi:pimeloyl-ACP methyl ester carboxylesterase|nr:alpha/beta hydrolase [Thermoanaerobaculia bacterium]
MYNKIRTALLTVFIAHTAIAQQVTFKPHKFESASGQVVDAEKGELIVRESRGNPDSRTITIRFVRFKSTAAKPGHPIVYLAGGPGGSGIGSAYGSRFPLFMALREFGDVIAYDQRGTNESGPKMTCDEQYVFPPGAPLDRAKGGAILAAALRPCVEKLRAEGVDVAAYNTRENAADLEDLRKALGAEKLVLWGISYGTHLTIAALRDNSAHIDRVILAGIEGADDTYKLPSDQQSLLEEIARRAPGDLLASMRNVLHELQKSPKTVSLTHPLNGMSADFVLGPLDFQVAVADSLFAPENFAKLPDFVSRLERGDWTALALAVGGQRFGSAPSVMSVAMDCASGITAARKTLIENEAKRTLLGDAINLPFPEVCAAVNVPDLGDAFRGPLRSDVPALLISGTLDGRTRPRQAEELRTGMPNARHLIIEGAGHSDPLFLSSPKILEAMKAFLRGEPLVEKTITLPPMQFAPMRTIANVSDEVLARHVGTYRVDEKTTRRVIKAGSQLYTVRGNNPPFPIRPISENEFFYENTGDTVRFEEGAMIYRTLAGEERRAKKE